MKKWYKSRTIKLAIFQGLVGIFFAFLAQYPELNAIGWVAFVKSVIDLVLRADTKSGIM